MWKVSIICEIETPIYISAADMNDWTSFCVQCSEFNQSSTDRMSFVLNMYFSAEKGR